MTALNHALNHNHSSNGSRPRVAVVGAGIVGLAHAWAAARRGWDVVLLERRKLTSWTTWHAAGLVGQLRGSRNMTRLAKYSADLYARLEEETGVATGLRRCGSLSLALRLGGLTPLGRLLRIVPRPLAEHPAWLTAISPVASVLVRGVSTAGSAGHGRREYYGVRAIRSILGVTASLDGADLGALGPLSPPVRFGFSSAPATPAIVDVTTTITLPRTPGAARERGSAS